MSQQSQKILVAPAWPYASGPRHIGHVAGFAVPADVFARYHRLKGNQVLMVSGTDEHGTPVMVSADKNGVSPRELADRNNALIREDLRNLGISYDCFTRTSTGNHYRVTQDLFRTLYDNGYLIEQTDARRVLRLDRPHTARPLHRGNVPDLRLPRGARRPVRQLRQPARPRRPDRPALDRRRLDAGVSRDDAALPRPARIRGAARGVALGAGGLAPEREELLARARPRVEAARDDARHRLGRPGAGRGLPRGVEAHLRLVRRRDRLPVGERRVGAQPRHTRRVARVVAEPGRGALLLHGEGQHRLPLGDLAGDAARLRPGRRARRRPWRAAPADERRRERVPDDGGEEGVDEPQPRDLGRATSSAATTPTRCATTSPPPARRRRTPTSRGTSSCGATTTSCSRTGATSSTARSSARTGTSARCRSRAS